MQPDATKFVSVTRFAEATSLGVRTVHRLIALHQIPSIRVGGRRLIPLSEALAALGHIGPTVVGQSEAAHNLGGVPR
jgi:excisionase family DNA binding protein